MDRVLGPPFETFVAMYLYWNKRGERGEKGRRRGKDMREGNMVVWGTMERMFSKLVFGVKLLVWLLVFVGVKLLVWRIERVREV